MRDVPSVAVVIPSYNHGLYIEETLSSVFRQTLRPREVHVIDDGSTDDSVEAVERAFAAAGPVRCSLTVRENRGISATRNELVAATTTDFVAFLDSDDLYAPTRLERMLAHAPRAGLFFAFSGVDFLGDLDDDFLGDSHEAYSQKLGQGMSFPTAGFALLRSNIAMTASNFLMSRPLFDLVGGFDERSKVLQDWDFAVQALRFVEPTFIPEPLLTYRIHSRNTSRNAQQVAKVETDLLFDKVSSWISRPTLNSRAPTARNWPRYFRLFARLCISHSGRALAAHLPPEVLTGPSEAAVTAGETMAIRDLLIAARSPEPVHDLSTDEMMRCCASTWSHRD
jgi:glycosyltransferase involved in cell wall biosynthesis